MSGGKPRQLHLDETMAATSWEEERGQALVNRLRREFNKEHHEEVLVDEEEFRQVRLTFSRNGDTYIGETSSTGIQAFTVIKGRVEVCDEVFGAGRSFLIPAAVGDYRLAAGADDVIVMQVISGEVKR